ncbi:TetR/AcrR family transcriptional regulator [Gordonia crocea]|uniref:TetR family transcriptional regulator n=1 Tax=Gordonia crocea TaxID=589162 RepID=A0A7M3STZ1_9ACTN|nr:TetR/AcrR family transcriptional regulator [Gordonia crocea]GED96115.1 TetR family transcriptional regulator [Gordonia crocea]
MSTDADTTTDATEAARAAGAAVRSRQILDAAARLMERSGSESVSMQALAAEAGVSVGLIYRYFGGKDEVLLAVIVDVLHAFAADVPEAVAAAGDDPVRRLSAAFEAYCRVIDRYRHAAVLTYRESNALSGEGREQIKHLEIETSQPLRTAVQEDVTSGRLLTDEPDLVAYNLLLLAHSWALKHWYFGRTLTLDRYIAAQRSLALRAIIAPQFRDEYRDLLD